MNKKVYIHMQRKRKKNLSFLEKAGLWVNILFIYAIVYGGMYVLNTETPASVLCSTAALFHGNRLSKICQTTNIGQAYEKCFHLSIAVTLLLCVLTLSIFCYPLVPETKWVIGFSFVFITALQGGLSIRFYKHTGGTDK